MKKSLRNLVMATTLLPLLSCVRLDTANLCAPPGTADIGGACEVLSSVSDHSLFDALAWRAEQSRHVLPPASGAEESTDEKRYREAKHEADHGIKNIVAEHTWTW